MTCHLRTCFGGEHDLAYSPAMFVTNPFSPGKRLTRPELFSGRRDQLTAAAQMLVQAANNNVRHALITGERGIGKSSFSSQVQGIARSDPEYLSLIGATTADFDYMFLVAEHVAQLGQGVPELAAGLLKAVETAKGSPRFAKFKFEFTVNLGVFQTVATVKDKPLDDLVVSFVNELEKVANAVGAQVNGIVLIVDEIDRIAAAEGISSFFKVVTELLAARGLENVMVLPVGLLGTLEQLKVEHPSVGRIFRTIEVPLLDDEERRDVVLKALTDTPVDITEDGLQAMSLLSGGYPNAVHQLGEAAFGIAITDGSNLIDESTVDAAKRAVVSGLAREDFDPHYVSLGRGRSRSIIRFMAGLDEWDVDAKAICAALKVKNTQLSADFDGLLRKDILVRPAPGVYRMREPLFREYVRYVIEADSEPVQRRPRKRSAST